MSEVDKLWEWCQENNVVNMGVTTAYELGLTDNKPTVEEIAAEINRVNKWLSDPINKLTSRLEGHIGLKKDTIMCMEKRTGLLEDGSWGSIPLTKQEERDVQRLKEDVELFELAIDMIKELNAKSSLDIRDE